MAGCSATGIVSAVGCRGCPVSCEGNSHVDGDEFPVQRTSSSRRVDTTVWRSWTANALLNTHRHLPGINIGDAEIIKPPLRRAIEDLGPRRLELA